MKKIFTILLCLSFICSSFFISCHNQPENGKNENGKNKKKTVPELKLVRLKIFEEDIDLDFMKFETSEKEIDIENITAWFSYGDVEEEAIGVNFDGKEVFNVVFGSTEIVPLCVPEEKGLYKAWNGKLKIAGVQAAMDLSVGWDFAPQPAGEATLETEKLRFSVIAVEDVMKTVTLNYDGQDVALSIDEERYGQTSYWVCDHLVVLPTDSSKEYKITVKPKDSERYKETEVIYKLKGTMTPKNNAEFLYLTDSDVDITVDIKYNENCDSNNASDYGVSSIKLVCSTVSPRAKVKAKIVDQKDENKLIGEEVTLENKEGKGVHEGEIQLLKDKPSKFVLYVEAQDGSKNDEKGKWTQLFNPVDLYWDYDAAKLATFELRKKKPEEYASIDVTKSEVKDDKIYLVFVTWGKKYGFEPKKEMNCTELDTFEIDGASQTAYMLEVDVQDVQAGGTKDVTFTIMKNKDMYDKNIDPPVEAFSYKVTIKMK